MPNRLEEGTQSWQTGTDDGNIDLNNAPDNSVVVAPCSDRKYDFVALPVPIARQCLQLKSVESSVSKK